MPNMSLLSRKSGAGLVSKALKNSHGHSWKSAGNLWHGLSYLKNDPGDQGIMQKVNGGWQASRGVRQSSGRQFLKFIEQEKGRSVRGLDL